MNRIKMIVIALACLLAVDSFAQGNNGNQANGLPALEQSVLALEAATGEALDGLSSQIAGVTLAVDAQAADIAALQTATFQLISDVAALQQGSGAGLAGYLHLGISGTAATPGDGNYVLYDVEHAQSGAVGYSTATRVLSIPAGVCQVTVRMSMDSDFNNVAFELFDTDTLAVIPNASTNLVPAQSNSQSTTGNVISSLFVEEAPRNLAVRQNHPFNGTLPGKLNSLTVLCF